MLMNSLEFLMMNNPVRAAIQRHGETRKLLGLAGPMPHGIALEVGCGRGVGTELILDRFRADRVDAFDLDGRMVSRARRRLASRGHRVRLWQGDATAIAAPDATYDAVFDFGILHHVPDWRAAVAEIYRVMKPGGRLYAEEALRPFIENRVARWAFKHPSDRFDGDEFQAALTATGFVDLRTARLGTIFAWFVARRSGASEPPSL